VRVVLPQPPEGMWPMFRSTRCLLTLLVLLTPALASAAQLAAPGDRPVVHVPLRPPTQAELDRLAATHLFAQGVLCEREARLLEAMRAYEQAARLDPDAVTIYKSLVMIYIALERHEDAAALLRKVLELDPHDYQMSYLYARQLRGRGRLDEACE